MTHSPRYQGPPRDPRGAAIALLGLEPTATQAEIRAAAFRLWSAYREAYPTERCFFEAIIDVEQDIALDVDDAHYESAEDLLGGFTHHEVVNALSDIFAAAITAEEREAAR